MDPISLLIIAGSAFLQYQANQDAQDRQESMRRAMEAYQRSRSAETEAATNELLTKQTPKARGQEMQDLTADRAQSIRDTVGAAQAFDAAPVAGKRSADYEATAAREADTRSAKLKRAIEQISTMGAPGEQEQKFGLRLGRAAGTVDAANRASANVRQGYLNDINGVRPDPGLMLASQIGMGVGTGMAMRGAGAPVDYEAAGYGAGEAGMSSGGGGAVLGGSSAATAAARRAALSRSFSLWGTR